MRNIQIAIDGPSGAGKSTMAKIIAKELGILYLDTGAMYRAVALKAIWSGIDTKNAEALSEMVKNIDLNIVYEDGIQKVILDGKDVTEDIRTPKVTVGSSDVAVIPAVREENGRIATRDSTRRSVIMDGRDIGTKVLPDADVKIFLTASVEDRTRRRYDGLKKRHIETDL